MKYEVLVKRQSNVSATAVLEARSSIDFDSLYSGGQVFQRFKNVITEMNIVDCNTHFRKTVDTVSSLRTKGRINEAEESNLVTLIASKMVPAVSNKTLKGYTSVYPVISEAVEEVLEADRILGNWEVLKNRFNMDKTIETNKADGFNSVVESLCSLVDTFEYPMRQKVRVCCETFPYIIRRNGLPFLESELYEGIMEYFLGNTTIISDPNIVGIRRGAASLGISEFVEPYLPREPIYRKMINSVNEGLKVEDIKSEVALMHLVTEMYEKMGTTYSTVLEGLSPEEFKEECSTYISSIHELTGLHDTMNSVCSLPLAIAASRSQISLYLNHCSLKDKTNGDRFKTFVSEQIKLQLSSEDYSGMGMTAVDEYYNRYINVIMSDRMFLEAKFDVEQRRKELSAISDGKDDAYKFIKEFLGSQRKDANLGKKVLKAIYPISVPRKLALLGPIFRVARACIFVGLTGPVGGLISTIVDGIIEKHLNKKDVKKLIKALEGEIKATSKKIKDGAEGPELNYCRAYMSTLKVQKKRAQSQLNNSVLAASRRLVTRENADETATIETFCDETLEFMGKLDALDYVTETLNNDPGLLERAISSAITNNGLGALVEMVANCPHVFDFDAFCESVKTNESFDPTSMQYYDVSFDKAYVSECSRVVDFVDEFYTLGEECVDSVYENSILDTIVAEAAILSAINEGIKISDIKMAWATVKGKLKSLSAKEQSMMRTIDAQANIFASGLEKALTDDRREMIIKGKILPSFSKCIRTAGVLGISALINPSLAMIGGLGAFAMSKFLSAKERQLILDEIDTELKVCEREINMAENDGDMERYRYLLNAQKRLIRERTRIKLKLKPGRVVIRQQNGN